MARPRKTKSDLTSEQREILDALRACCRDLDLVPTPGVAGCAEAQHTDPLHRDRYRSWAEGRSAVGYIVPSLREINIAFGNWREAASKIGVGDRRGPNHVVGLQDVKRSFGEIKKLIQIGTGQPASFPALTEARYEELRAENPQLRLVSAWEIKQFFTWATACREHGLSAGKFKSVRDIEDLEDRIYEICEEHGGPLSVRSFDLIRPSGFPTAQNIARTLGIGWREVLSLRYSEDALGA